MASQKGPDRIDLQSGINEGTHPLEPNKQNEIETKAGDVQESRFQLLSFKSSFKKRDANYKMLAAKNKLVQPRKE